MTEVLSKTTELLGKVELERLIERIGTDASEAESSAREASEQLDTLGDQVTALFNENAELRKQLANERDYTLKLQRAVNWRECNCPNCGQRVSITKATA